MSVLIGAVLVISACGYMGFVLAGQKRVAAERTEGYMLLLKHMQDRLPSLMDMDSIVADFENKALCQTGELAIIKEGNSPCNKRLAAAIELQKDDTALYAIIGRLSKGLGGTDYDRQQKDLQEAYIKLCELNDKRQKELQSGEKCYKWLGVLAGALTVILLL